MSGLQDRVATRMMGAGDFLAREGSDWTYTRGATTGTIAFYKADLPPSLVDSGTGQLTEVIMASFRGLFTSLAAFDKPLRGDKITDGTLTYEVQPIIDKCYYAVGGLVHIHAKRVAG